MKKTKIICFVNEKGGVGKTTTTCETAYFLGKSGYKILVVDLDGQANSTKHLTGSHAAAGSFDLFTDQEIDIIDLIKPAKTYWKNVYCVGASKMLNKVDLVIANEPQRELILKNKLDEIKAKFDFILIDLPPALNMLTANALCASTHYVLMTDNSTFSKDGFNSIFSMAKKFNPLAEFAGVVMVRCQKEQSTLMKQFIKEIDVEFGDKKIRSNIADSVKVVESLKLGKPIEEIAPKSKPCEQYDNLSKSIISL